MGIKVFKPLWPQAGSCPFLFSLWGQSMAVPTGILEPQDGNQAFACFIQFYKVPKIILYKDLSFHFTVEGDNAPVNTFSSSI